jgi:hypothetical protein
MTSKPDGERQKTHYGRALCVAVIGLLLGWLTLGRIDHAGATRRIGLILLWTIVASWVGVVTGITMLWAGHKGLRPPPARDRLAVRLFIVAGAVATLVYAAMYVVYLRGGFDAYLEPSGG